MFFALIYFYLWLRIVCESPINRRPIRILFLNFLLPHVLCVCVQRNWQDFLFSRSFLMFWKKKFSIRFKMWFHVNWVKRCCLRAWFFFIELIIIVLCVRAIVINDTPINKSLSAHCYARKMFLFCFFRFVNDSHTELQCTQKPRTTQKYRQFIWWMWNEKC